MCIGFTSVLQTEVKPIHILLCPVSHSGSSMFKEPITTGVLSHCDSGSTMFEGVKPPIIKVKTNTQSLCPLNEQ